MQCPRHALLEPCPKCADDSTLVRQVQTLDSETETSDALEHGTKVSRYLIGELIGRGGMGLVYTAFDPDLGRPVAIKLLREKSAAGSGSTSLGQARLLREAQAMAQLSHPNVMPVYDVGKFETSVFVAMELVRGPTLDRWVKAQRRTWRDVLHVFLQAGRGLQAAHAAGLVHRDFKPANVLMGEDGRPRVTDFGIARSMRAVDPEALKMFDPTTTPTSLETPLTRAGVMMGSPGYMAPEQYAGRPTSPATDQFSFCVALYEALYGARPFLGATLSELAHVTGLGRVPPAPPDSDVPAWLHRIVERGLQVEPANRHPSMTALLDALARDPEQELRVRLAIGAVAVTVVALAVAAVWSQVQQRQACRGAEQLLEGVWDDRVRAAGKQAFEATGKSYAAPTWDQARGELDAYALSWLRARTEACEATRVRGEQPEPVMTARFDCLEQRKRDLEALAKAYAVADVETVDHAYGAASRLSAIDACAHVRTGQPTLTPELKGAADELGRELADGRTQTSAGKLVAARAHLDRALTLARALKLTEQEAETSLALAQLEHDAFRYREAAEAYATAARLAETVGDDETATRALISMVSEVGWRLERPDDGRMLATLAAGKLERMGGDARLAAALSEGLGDVEWQGGKRAASLVSYRKSLQGFVSVGGEESLDAARLHASISWMLAEQGELVEARAELEKARRTFERLLGADHPAMITMWNNMGSLAGQLGDDAEAVRCHARQVQLAHATYGPDHINVVRGETNLAVALVLTGESEQAATLLAHVLRVEAQVGELPVQHRLQVLRGLGLVEARRGNWKGAEQKAREATEIAARAFGPEHPLGLSAGLDLAEDLEALGDHRAALERFDHYLAVEEKLGATAEAEFAAALSESAQVLLALKRDTEAFARFERAVKLRPLDQGNLKRAGDVRFRYAQALGAVDRTRARQLAREARGCYEKSARAADVKRVDAWLAANPEEK